MYRLVGDKRLLVTKTCLNVQTTHKQDVATHNSEFELVHQEVSPSLIFAVQVGVKLQHTYAYAR